jgi:hypothetical protein
VVNALNARWCIQHTSRHNAAARAGLILVVFGTVVAVVIIMDRSLRTFSVRSGMMSRPLHRWKALASSCYAIPPFKSSISFESTPLTTRAESQDSTHVGGSAHTCKAFSPAQAGDRDPQDLNLRRHCLVDDSFGVISLVSMKQADFSRSLSNSMNIFRSRLFHPT